MACRPVLHDPTRRTPNGRGGDRRSGLVALDGLPLPVWHSEGLAERAGPIAERCATARHLLSELFEIEPAVELLVLTEKDWPGHAAHPLYGMPNSTRDTVVVAGEPNRFWLAFIDMVDDEGRTELAEAYRDGTGEIDLSPFFDLLAIHELSHVYQAQGRVRFPRLWLNEFFCNLCLHAYVVAEEPERLPELLTFPRVVSTVSADRFEYRTEQDFERLYDEMPGTNYGWFQCRMHAGAASVYDGGGIRILKRLWDHYQSQVDRSQLVRDLSEVDASLGTFAHEFTG